MLNIITNASAMAASRALEKNQKALAESFQRLSTGVRINSAKDDAAGNAVANRLTAQLRGLNQAIRNANDGISMLQTAESAVTEQQGMLQRLRELAVQASSDSNTASDRAAIQAEADALVSEIDRIATQTDYNGRRLLDGTLSDAKYQLGANESQTVSLTLRGSRTFNLGAVYTATTASVGSTAITANAVSINGVAIRATTSSDDTVSSSGNTASAIAKAAAINASTAQHGVTAEVNANVFTATAAMGAVVTADVVFTINGVTVTVAQASQQTNDSNSAVRNAINALSGSTGVIASVDSSNVLSLTASDGRNIVLGGLAAAETTYLGTGIADGTYTGTLSLKSESTFSTSGDGTLIGSPTAAVRATNVSTLSLTSQSGATSAIDVIDDAIGQLNNRQATLGALLNRMDRAVSSLSAAAENIAAARGRVQDADFAAETANFSKNQILVQASAAMLAQSNVTGQVALQLLG